MSDLKIKPEFRQSFVTHVESDGQTLSLWAQTHIKDVLKFEAIRDSNYGQMFEQIFQSERQINEPLVEKHYIFCDKSKSLQFFRVLVKGLDTERNEAHVFFIDFGYEESVPIASLFVFTPLFIDCRPLTQRFILADIRPKDETKGFDGQRVVKSLQRYLRSVFIFAIIGDNRIKVMDNDGEDIIRTCLLNDGIDDIVFEANQKNSDLFAIDFDNESESNRNSSTFTSDCKSLTQISEVVSNSFAEEMPKNLIDLNESQTSVKSSDHSFETPKSESTPVSTPQFSDRTTKKELIFHMKTMFGPQKHSVYVTKTLSAKSIFLQLKDNWNSINELVQKMNDCYENSVQKDEYALRVEDICPDSVIAAKFTEDQNWYRASVIDVKRKKCLVKVFYIDFGNTETIEIKFCRELKPEFKEMAPQAIHCHPLNEGLGAHTLEIYETNTVELECKFEALEDRVMDVLLYDHGNLLGGDSVASSPPRDKETEVEPREEEESAPKESNGLSTLTLNEVLRSKALMEETEEMLLSLEGTEAKAYISKARSTQSVFCIPIKSLEETVDLLIEDMTDFYSAQTKPLALTDAELIHFQKTRSLVAAFCQLQEKWLRAVISEITAESVKVVYVDFGTEGSVEARNCRHLDDLYFRPVLQAIHCRPLNNNMSYYELKTLESSEKRFGVRFEKKKEKVFDVLFRL